VCVCVCGGVRLLIRLICFKFEICHIKNLDTFWKANTVASPSPVPPPPPHNFVCIYHLNCILLFFIKVWPRQIHDVIVFRIMCAFDVFTNFEISLSLKTMTKFPRLERELPQVNISQYRRTTSNSTSTLSMATHTSPYKIHHINRSTPSTHTSAN
jgi:hypothetical protein